MLLTINNIKHYKVLPPLSSMFIEFILEGDDTPKLFPIEKAGKIAYKLEKTGKKFRLGNTQD